jgi:hypothetical protein
MPLAFSAFNRPEVESSVPEKIEKNVKNLKRKILKIIKL